MGGSTSSTFHRVESVESVGANSTGSSGMPRSPAITGRLRIVSEDLDSVASPGMNRASSLLSIGSGVGVGAHHYQHLDHHHQQQQRRAHESSPLLSHPTQRRFDGAHPAPEQQRQQQHHGSIVKHISIDGGEGDNEAEATKETPSYSLCYGAASPRDKDLSGPTTAAATSPNGAPHHHHAAPPRLIRWIFPALGCALAYALYNIFIKKGSASIHPVLGGVILQIVAAVLGSCLLGALACSNGAEMAKARAKENGATKTLNGYDSGWDARQVLGEYDYHGIMWSIWAGVAVGVAEMLSFTVSGMGVPAVQSIPILIGGSVMFGSVLGWLALREVLTLQGWAGVLLLVLGIGMVATDPGFSSE